ncbi:MAG TPA: hypothetical protein VII35_03405, partial [Steroidobacteraceae bacterium]
MVAHHHGCVDARQINVPSKFTCDDVLDTVRAREAAALGVTRSMIGQDDSKVQARGKLYDRRRIRS